MYYAIEIKRRFSYEFHSYLLLDFSIRFIFYFLFFFHFLVFIFPEILWFRFSVHKFRVHPQSNE